MPKIRLLEIKNFRSIKNLVWAPNSGLNCLIGPGDSGKTTALDAIEACLAARRSLSFDDADFHALNVEEPIVIRVTIGTLPDHLKDLDAFGDVLRGFDPQKKSVEDEPGEGLEVVLTCELLVGADLDPKRRLYSDRTADDTRVRQLQWKDRSLFAPSRIGEHANFHLSWSRTSVLGKLAESKLSVGMDLISAARAARLSFGDRAGAQLEDVLALVTSKANAMGVDVGDSARALLDSGALSFSDGAIALHAADGVPLRGLGTGSTRLVLAGLHREISASASAVLIDEVEHGLEPHRVIRLLHSLGSKDALKDGQEPAVQAFMTTHSPVVVRELSGDQLFILRRSDAGAHEMRSVGSGDPIQGTARTYPEAFLANTVVVCEGASEVGLLRGVDRFYVESGKPSAYGSATAFVDAGGRNPSYILERGRIFAQWGYQVKVFLDNDVEIPTDDKRETLAKGVKVYHWDERDALEQALFRYLSDDGIDALVALAIEKNSPEIINGSLELASKGQMNLDDVQARFGTDAAWDLDDRLTLGAAAKLTTKDSKTGPGHKGWFKSITKMEAVGREVLGPYLAKSDPKLEAIMQALFEHAHG